jgi:hypothetical protein
MCPQRLQWEAGRYLPEATSGELIKTKRDEPLARPFPLPFQNR